MAALVLSQAWRLHQRAEASIPRGERQHAELRFIDAATRLAVLEAGMNPYAPSQIPLTPLRGEE